MVDDDPTWLPASVVDEAARVAGRIGDAATAVLVLGPRGSGRRTVAARIGAALGQAIVVADRQHRPGRKQRLLGLDVDIHIRGA